MCALWLAVITSHEATVTVHELKWKAVMLQCHFLGFVLSNTLLSMRAFVPLILSFISNYALYVEQGFNALQNIPNTYWIVVGSAVVDTLGMHAMVRYLLEY
ncbi:hypothetical protein BCT58_08455 [Vibrio lentus]|nr:hypothetical protein BCT58_08455 [Vibrio lentus]